MADDALRQTFDGRASACGALMPQPRTRISGDAQFIGTCFGLMAVMMFPRAANLVFIDCDDCIDMQIGAAVIPDHDLPGPSNSMMSHIVIGSSTRKPSTVDVHVCPCFTRIISYKDCI